MQIVADENIPLVKELFGFLGDVILLPGRQIQPQHVKNADILLVRSVTNVNETLLSKSRVKFVGTTTTGTEHVDTNWLQQAGIAFADAKGCNAEAVAEYVVCCIAALQQENILLGKELRAGVIGIGHVGNAVCEKLKLLGFDVIQNDPLRAAQENNFISTPLEKFHDCDLICLHPALIKNDPYPSFHLIEKTFLQRLKPGTVLLNASRGAVINSVDLLSDANHLIWCFDVFEHEPQINLELLKQATIATPHIAGYTYEAKLRGTMMIFESAQLALRFSANTTVKSQLSTITQEISYPTTWRDAVLSVYNPEQDTAQTKDALLTNVSDCAHHFDLLRKHHSKRHEFNTYLINNISQLDQQHKTILQQLGFQLTRTA